MIIIKLYNNTSENNAVMKKLTELATTQGTLKDSTSILSPVLLLSKLSIDIMSKCNYVEIVELARKYFVQDIKIARNDLYQITAKIDVLTTYATQIKEQTAVIKRQENKWNLYLDDGIYKTYQNPDIVTKAFPTGFSTQSFVLTVAGG